MNRKICLAGTLLCLPVAEASAIDISQRKKAEEALQVSENHFRLLVEQASDGIFIANAEGKYLDVNSAGADMLGYTRDEILQLSLPDILAAEEHRVAAHVARFTGGEWTFRRKHGSFFPGEVSGSSSQMDVCREFLATSANGRPQRKQCAGMKSASGWRSRILRLPFSTRTATCAIGGFTTPNLLAARGDRGNYRAEEGSKPD
jgi:PAS domain S-box-containing protein